MLCKRQGLTPVWTSFPRASKSHQTEEPSRDARDGTGHALGDACDAFTITIFLLGLDLDGKEALQILPIPFGDADKAALMIFRCLERARDAVFVDGTYIVALVLLDSS